MVVLLEAIALAAIAFSDHTTRAKLHGRNRSLLLLEQVLEDQGRPALAPRLHKRAALFELP